jgi:3-oxoacyl-[acyl-carrier-protein] synthase III
MREREIIAAYFLAARAAISGALRQANLRPEEIDLVIPTEVNATIWPILLRLCGIPEQQLYSLRLRFGHPVSRKPTSPPTNDRRPAPGDRG